MVVVLADMTVRAAHYLSIYYCIVIICLCTNLSHYRYNRGAVSPWPSQPLARPWQYLCASARQPHSSNGNGSLLILADVRWLLHRATWLPVYYSMQLAIIIQLPSWQRVNAG